LIVTLFTGVVSGSYPALFLSHFHPIRIIRGGTAGGDSGALFRKILVVFQFSISVILIVSTILIYNQVHYMMEKELGYDKEHLIFLPLRGDSRESYDAVKVALLQKNSVLNVSGTNHNPIHIGSNSSGIDWDGKDPELRLLVSTGAVDFDYVETMGIELLEGRSFSKAFSTDTAGAFLINQALLKIMGKESAVNERLNFGREGTIVGVMKNYHFQSIENKIEPLAIHVDQSRINYMLIRLSPGNIQDQIADVEDTWNQIIPDYPFDYYFVDEALTEQYAGWSKVSTLLRSFAILAILIACLGLFGLASFSAEQRTKEIGVRKVLGATVGNLIILMSKDFTKWVLIANLIAWPLAYYLMNAWMADLAYRIDIGFGVFLLTGLVTLVIALLTVSYQSVKAALTNPVDSIKYE
jgi:ABC-type antimicrobial peptide transport system permease subunit